MSANTAPTFFVGDGIVITPIGSGTDIGRGVALQADGRIIVGGLVGTVRTVILHLCATISAQSQTLPWRATM